MSATARALKHKAGLLLAKCFACPVLGQTDERHDLEARAGMLHETVQVANYSAVTHLAVSVVLGIVFWDHAPDSYLIGLNVLMFLLTATTLAITLRCRDVFKTSVSDKVVRRGILLSQIVALLIGLVWSTMPALLIPYRESGYQLVAVATTAGLISDAYVVGPFLSVSILLVAPIVVGTYVGLSFCEYPFGAYISALLTVYALFVLLSTRGMSAMSYQRLLDRIMVRDQSQTIGLLLNEFEEGASDWLWETDMQGRLRHVPARMAALIGFAAETLRDASLPGVLAELGCAETEANGVAQVTAALSQHRPFHDHLVRLTIGGNRRWWSLNGKPCHDAAGRFIGFRGVGSDITLNREAEARIAYLAGHDPLTALANRSAFQQAIETACRPAGRRNYLIAVLYVDLDGFKAVNDGNSHAAGDLLLQSVASRLHELCDRGTQIFRLGGDEFAVLHGCTTIDDGERLAGRIVESLRRPYDLDGLHLVIGASVGLAYTPDDAKDPVALLTRADLALYSAKALGKGQWQRFDPELEQRTLRRRQLDTQMRVALSAGGFELHYQPVVELQSGRVVGVEALLRWNMPGQGWISPAEIVPVAESTGFITEIGQWALLRACTDVLAWPGLTVAVNISSVHFRSPTFCDQVEAVLRQTGLSPPRLEIEITESILLEGGADVIANMRRLRAKGIRLALDDFGTGYSSLSYLTKFTFDKLKIDRSFVSDLHRRPDTLAIFEAIHTMAQALTIAVTVEGVETEQQIAILRGRYKGTVQGYYYSQALPAGALDAWILEFKSNFATPIASHDAIEFEKIALVSSAMLSEPACSFCGV